MGRLGALLLLLGALGALADICNIPEVDSSLVQTLGQRLLPWMDQLSLEHLNPSIYVGLRLSSVEASTREALYLHSLKVDYQQSLLRHAPSDDNSDLQAKPSMGQLALYMLALKANCEFIGGHKGDRLVSLLKRFLEDEKRAIGHDHKGQPHTSYYQYGLSILALCVHQKRVHDSVVGKLLYAVEHDHHLHQGHLSVAPPLCHQLLMTSPMPGTELGTACLNARAALLASLQDGAFQNALMISQLLPVLNHKSYVDLISPDCLAPRVTLEPATVTPSPMQVPEFIHVMLKVPSVWPPYRHSISVPAGSSLEEVLMTAQELGGFMYGTQASLSGPYLTSVMGKEAGEREFWQLVRAPDTPLQQGIADYRPKDGETIELRLVTW
ncbi:PREDICTED: transcobalamin-2 [Myotis davidii]|uniref:transcobalamin-2 n=1 Tax=Myotis davidii TaxID=225400 RepID=UPI000766E52E|nr:PREDICTED: transcobalamin-2 [Myotis davidii]